MIENEGLDGRNNMGASPKVEVYEKFTAGTIVWQNYLKKNYGTVVNTVTNKDKWCKVKAINGAIDTADSWRTKGLRKK